MYFKRIETYTLLSILFWIALQMYFIYIYWGVPQYSDAETYTHEALKCYLQGEWYPNAEQVQNSQYIFNPGYINYLILQLNIFGSLAYNSILGLFLNIILLCSIFTIIKRIVNIEAAYWGIILFCVMSTNIVSPVLIMSDLLFTTLLFMSFALIRKTNLCLIIAAFFLCLSNYVRPVMAIFALPLLLVFFFNKYKLIHYLYFAGSFIVFYLILNVGVVKFTSARNQEGTTLGVNLIMAANEDANGAYNDIVFEKGKIGYLEKKYNVYEKDSVWKSRSINWIKNNPIKYIKPIPFKILYLWGGDSYVFTTLDDNQREYTKEESRFSGLTKSIFLSLGYYLCLLLSFVGVWKLGRKIYGYWGIFLLPIILATGMHCILYSAMRYHYSYVPILIFYAVIGILSIKYKNINFLKR